MNPMTSTETVRRERIRVGTGEYGPAGTLEVVTTFQEAGLRGGGDDDGPDDDAPEGGAVAPLTYQRLESLGSLDDQT